MHKNNNDYNSNECIAVRVWPIYNISDFRYIISDFRYIGPILAFIKYRISACERHPPPILKMMCVPYAFINSTAALHFRCSAPLLECDQLSSPFFPSLFGAASSFYSYLFKGTIMPYYISDIRDRRHNGAIFSQLWTTTLNYYYLAIH